jgi:hypothetical protein
MKKIIIASASIILALSACKEQIPSGLQLTGGGVQFGDTSYILTSIPTAQLKNVLVEEFTAVRCSNCPEATASLKTIEKANPGRLFVAKLHTGSLGFPIKPTDPDLRNNDAIDVDNLLGGSAQGQPAAVIDRIPNTATGAFSYVYTTGVWPSLIAQQLAQSTPVNLSLTGTKTSDTTVKATCDFTLTDTTSAALSYGFYIIEDGIKATQDSSYTINGQITTAKLDYKHDGLFRASITPAVVGSNLLHPNGNTLQEKGRTYRRILNITKPANVVDLNNCRLFLFVQNASTKKVLQVTSGDL